MTAAEYAGSHRSGWLADPEATKRNGEEASHSALCPLLRANRQRIVELFPTAHRRASVMPNRQCIVEIGGGSSVPSCVLVRPGATAGLLQPSMTANQMAHAHL